MHVDEMNLVGVDLGPQRWVALIGRAEADGVGGGKRAIERFAGRGPGKDAELERAAGGMGRFRSGSQRARNGLGAARGRKAAEADRIAVVDQRRRLIGCQDREGGLAHGVSS
jgi:hypothetical protein